MKYYLDTEFIEYPNTIDLISIALVREDGRYLYAENSECDLSMANEFVKRHVIPQLIMREGISHTELMPDNSLRIMAPRRAIVALILGLIGDDTPEFWGYYADYDWVAFCWLFGEMARLPEGWPMYCGDLKQLADHIGIEESQFPAAPSTEHNALSDARWNRDLHKFLTEQAGPVVARPG